MITSKDDHSGAFLEADYQRKAVIGTLSLQASIIEAAKETPQIINTVELQAGKKHFWLRPAFALMAFASLLLVVGVSLFDLSFSSNNLSLDTYSESDLEWQELMLIDDELLFAQLLN